MVEEIPYKEAFTYYAPRLQASGRKVASSGTYRERLRAAFLSSPKRDINLGQRPVDVRPSETVTMEEAKAKFSSAAPQERAVYVEQDRAHKNSLKKARQKIAAAYRSGMLSKAQTKELFQIKDPQEILRSLAKNKMKSVRGSQEYSGEKNEHAFQQSLPTGVVSEKKRAREAQQLKEKHEKKVQSKVAKIKAAVNQGLRGRDLQKYIRRCLSKEDLKVASPILNPFLEKTQALSLEKVESREYRGAIEHRHQEHRRTAHKKKISQQDRAVTKVSRWIRKQMSEGVAGRTLSGLLQAKFAPSFLKSAAKEIEAVRSQHEGLSGHAYVDAEAYASPQGTTGCEEGALRHRANQLKFVLAMDRCTGCAFSNRDADGRSICQKYNKRLAFEVPVENPQEYQQEMLRMADASDAEQTANLFNPREFGLRNTSLDGFDLEGSASIAQLGDVFFGGLEIEED